MVYKHAFTFVVSLMLVTLTYGTSNLCGLGQIPSSCSLSTSSLKYAAPPAVYTLTSGATSAEINKTGSDWQDFMQNTDPNSRLHL